MAEKVIIDIEIDGTKSIDTMNKLNAEIKLQKQLLNEAKIGSEEYTNAGESLNKLQKVHRELTDEINKEEKAQKQLAKEMERTTLAAKKAEEQQRKYMEMATMETKSLGDLETKLFGMKKVYRGMPQDTEKAKASAERFAVAIRELDKVVKKGGEGLGEYQRYVGNYERGLMGLDMSFGQTGNSFADFDRDVTQYKESTKTAGFSTDNLEKSVNKMPNALAAMAVGIGAAIAVITKLTQSVQQSIDTFLRQEDANDMVNDVFGEYSSVINQAANDTQKFTKIGNEQYQELAVQAKNFGIANKDVNQTVQDAIGLADLYGSAGANEAGMLEALIDAQNGKTKGLEKYVKELRGVTDEEERNRILQEKIAKGWEMASTAGATYGDQITMITNATGDMQEELGEQVMEGIFGSPAEIGKVKKEVENMITAMERTGVIAKTLDNIKGIYQSIIQPIADLAKRLGIASDNTELFEVVLRGVGKVFEFLLTPIKLIYNNVGTMINYWVGWYDILSNIKDASFEDIFTLIKQTAFDLISPLTDLIGVSDEVAAMFGAQTNAIKMTREELDKLNVLSGQYTKNVKDQAKAQADANDKAKKDAELTEEQKKAKEDAINKNKEFNKTLEQINAQYELQMYFARTLQEEQDAARIKAQATFDAYKQFYAEGGYTGQELEKLRELKNEILDLNATFIQEIDDTDGAYTAELEKQFQAFSEANNAKLEAERQYLEEQQALIETYSEKERAEYEKKLQAEKDSWNERRQIAESTAVEFGNIIASSIDETGFSLEKFGKMYTQFILDQMQKVVYAAIAEITAREFATKGLAGAVTAGLINASVIAAFQVAKSLVSRSGGFAEGGFTGHGGKYEPAGTVHKGEVVFSQADVAALGGAQTVDAMRPTSKQNYYVGGIVGSVPQPVNSSAMLLDAIRQIRPVVTVQDINAVAQAESNRQQIAVI